MAEAIEKGLSSESFRKEYATVADGDANWQGLKFPDRRRVRVGAGLDVYSQGAVLRRHHQDAGGGDGHSRARGCWRCWATR